MSAREVALVIVGAGPGGLAAAAEAAGLGVETVVLDMYARPGGQYYRQPAYDAARASDVARSGFGNPPGATSAVEREGLALIDAARRAGAEIVNDATVWGLFPEQPFLIRLSAGGALSLSARTLILATGAYDRPLPFPGWTLPGVMTTGGVQALLKEQGVLPGRRFLLSGSGPLQLAAAAHLAAAGASVPAVLETRRLRSFLRLWPQVGAILAQGERLAEGYGYLRTLRAAGATLRFGWAVLRAEGAGQVERAIVGRVDADGRPMAGTEQTLAVDTICLGYGLLPATQLSRQLGCEHRLDPHLGAHVPLRDAWFQTSLAGAFVVGDAAGIAGKEAARLEGRLAGLAVARQLGVLTEAQAAERARPLWARWRREQCFAAFLQEAFGLLSGMAELAGDDTVLCRCEGVTLGQVKRALADGADSFPDVKAHTRAGMGRCQGRMCSVLIAPVIAQTLGYDLERASRYSVRPPAFPVALDELEEL